MQKQSRGLFECLLCLIASKGLKTGGGGGSVHDLISVQNYLDRSAERAYSSERVAGHFSLKSHTDGTVHQFIAETCGDSNSTLGMCYCDFQ